MTNTDIKNLLVRMRTDNEVGRHSSVLRELQELIFNVDANLALELPGIDEIWVTDPVSAIPTTSVDGYRFLNTITGVNSGDTYTATYIYTYVLATTSWSETIPVTGDNVFNADDSKTYLFNGTAWVEIPTPA